MLTVLAFLKTHWKKVVFVLLPVATFILGANMFEGPGTTTTITKVEFKEKIVEVEKVVFVDRTKEDSKVNRHVEKTKTVTPDGTVTEKEVSDTQEVKTVFVDRVVVKEVEKVVEVEKKSDTKTVVDKQKRFRLAAMVGVHPDILPVPKINSWAVGGEADVRVVGPVWAGVWAMGTTSGQALGGISIGVEF